MENNQMNSYELKQVEEIKKWKNEEPSVISKATGWVLKPISKMVEKVVPQSVIRGALVGSDWLAEKLTDKKDIMRDGGVKSINELATKSLELSDKLANNVHNWAIGTALVEGAATGITGLPGMAIDIPALIVMTLRVIRKIGLCYGYDCDTEKEKQFVFGIMSAAGANSVNDKMIALANIQATKVIISKTAWRKMAEKAANNKFSKEAIVLAVKNLAKQLGVNLTKRKALQAIPIIGGAVGASMNVAFINDAAWAARRAFQELWLQDNGKIIEI